MKPLIPTAVLCALLAAAAGATAQVPSGGPGSDAKANALLKAPHTVNDGGARRGHNSFTEGQARKHIIKAGYASVTGLSKGKDGVWRGTAMKNGASVDVGMDYKGNVSEGGGMASASSAMSSATTSTTATTTGMSGAEAPAAAPMTTTATATTAHAKAHHRRHHAMKRCADSGPNGAACSGIDRNRNGVSDKEDRAIKAGARP